MQEPFKETEARDFLNTQLNEISRLANISDELRDKLKKEGKLSREEIHKLEERLCDILEEDCAGAMSAIFAASAAIIRMGRDTLTAESFDKILDRMAAAFAMRDNPDFDGPGPDYHGFHLEALKQRYSAHEPLYSIY